MKGFTMVEVLVVMAITVFMTGVLITNFSRTRVDLNQTRLMVQDAVREAQSLALSGALYNDTYRCGYGIHFEESTYTIYAAPAADDVDCTTLDRNYDEDEDEVVRTGIISNTTIRIGAQYDIFFEPPKPTTYIDNQTDHAPAVITVRRSDAVCGAASTPDCRIIHVTTSGLITTK